MAAVNKPLVKELHCSLCLEEMIESRLLPCHHGLCLNCLEKYVDSSMKDNKLTCPVCRAKCTVPEGGVQHISQNRPTFIHSLRGALESDVETSETEQLPFCTRHPNQMMEWYCDQCSLPCCATCVALYHRPSGHLMLI